MRSAALQLGVVRELRELDLEEVDLLVERHDDRDSGGVGRSAELNHRLDA